MQRLADELGQIPCVGVGDPAFERDPEDRDGRLSDHACVRLVDAALAQRGGERGGHRCELDQLALLKLRVGRDDGLALAGELVAVAKGGGDGFEADRDRFDRRRGGGRAGEGVDEALLELVSASEEDLSLVREVSEEGPLGQPCAGGDVLHRRVLEPALGELLQRRLLEAAARIRLPSTHGTRA